MNFSDSESSSDPRVAAGHTLLNLYAFPRRFTAAHSRPSADTPQPNSQQPESQTLAPNEDDFKTIVESLVKEIGVAARSPSLAAMPIGQVNLTVAEFLQEQAAALKSVSDWAKFNKMPEDNEDWFTQAQNAIHRIGATLDSINNSQHEHIRDNIGSLQREIDGFIELCRVPPSPEAESLALLRKMCGQSPWIRELISDQTLLGHFKLYLEKCFIAMGRIQMEHREIRSLSNSDARQQFLVELKLLEGELRAIEHWDGRHAQRGVMRTFVSGPRQENSIHDLENLLARVGKRINDLSYLVGIKEGGKFAIDFHAPLTTRNHATQQANVAKRHALSFGRSAAMSARKANIYGLI